MNSQTSKWQQIGGVVFLVLAVLLYALEFVHLPGHSEKLTQAQQNFTQLFTNPVMLKAIASQVPAFYLVAHRVNPLPISLLLVGIAWTWNRRRQVASAAYGGLFAYLLAAGILLAIGLFKTRNIAPRFPIPIVILIVIFIALAALCFWLSRRALQQSVGAQPVSGTVDAGLVETTDAVPLKAAMRATQKRWQVCNVLQAGPMQQRVWHFDARDGGFALSREHAASAGEALPGVVAKSWSSLWQPKLNVAWLPPENVFIRVAHFPESTFDETLAMVELQMEKLSPVPVTQALWTMHVLPQTQVNMQTVVVVVVARSVVEEFLGDLESRGYMPDRLELPLLDQLQTTEANVDGAWVYPEAQGGPNSALVAWWYGGVLRNLDLVTLPAGGDRAAIMKDQLLQMSWGGELEGWLTAPPKWYLVADETGAAQWLPVLQQSVEQPVEVVAPLPAPALAALTAGRAAHADPRANLLPIEFATRYQRQFVDRLWMRGLLTALGLYCVGVVIFFVALGVLNFRVRRVENQVKAMSMTYTNAIELKARYEVLKERQDLKWAALDCWEAVANHLPASLTLEQLKFIGGTTLSLDGNATDASAVLEFADRLRRASARGQPLFDVNRFVPPTTQVGAGGSVRWTYQLTLKRSITK